MSHADDLARAIRQLWPTWAASLGPAWPPLAHKLLAHLAALDADPDQWALTSIQLQATLRDAGLWEQVRTEVSATALESYRHADDDGPAAAPPLADGVVTRYTDISCPRRIWVEERRMLVGVRLTMQPPATSDAPPVALPLRTGVPVEVTIHAPGFVVEEPRQQQIPVKPYADSDPIVFFLHPQQVGFARISLDFRQDGGPLPSVVWEVEVTAEPAPMQEMRFNQVLTLEPDATPPDLVLYVAEDIIKGQPHLRFTLYEAGQAAGRSFPPLPLTGDLRTYADALYEQLSALTDDAAARGATWGEALTDATRQLGYKLWHELFPAEFKRLYAEKRELWRDRTVLIISDEPFIPWELVYPFDANWEDDLPWCLTFRFTRWLRKGEHVTGCNAPPVSMTLGHFAHVAPADAGLDYAKPERIFLDAWMAKHQIQDASPEQCTRLAVEALVRRGGYDWLHLLSHGSVGVKLGARQGVIQLENNGDLSADCFIGPGPMRHLGQAHPGFVFNACHSDRQDWGLTHLSGWAPRLLELGASVVVAPRWAVTDAAAYRFAETFYDALSVAPVGEAVRRARLAAQDAGDPSWLAYAVYAYPLAQVQVGPA